MLRLPAFDVLRPTTVREVVDALARFRGRARLLAGGTDLVPNLKHRLYEPDVVVALSGVQELRGIREHEDGSLAIGAMTTLEECAASDAVRRRVPGLAQAAAAVAGPTQRSMGTLGGNVCLDTRCVWINQTHFWRKALGFCLKKDGSVCHVVAGGLRCVAAASNDAGTMLVALDATLAIRSAAGERRVRIREFYKPDGKYNLRLEPDELLTDVVVPPQPAGRRSGYSKLRPRQSIDFPKLSVAAVFDCDAAGRMTDLVLAISAIAAVPKVLGGMRELVAGRAPDDPALLRAVGERARRSIHPLTNLDGDAEYRRAMVPVHVARAIRAAQ